MPVAPNVEQPVARYTVRDDQRDRFAAKNSRVLRFGPVQKCRVHASQFRVNVARDQCTDRDDHHVVKRQAAVRGQNQRLSSGRFVQGQTRPRVNHFVPKYPGDKTTHRKRAVIVNVSIRIWKPEQWECENIFLNTFFLNIFLNTVFYVLTEVRSAESF